MRQNTKKLLPHLAIFLALTAGNAAFASELDHREFEATLHVPYKAAAQNEARAFTLEFDYPYVTTAQDISWRVELVGPNGHVVQRWNGVQRLFKNAVKVDVKWNGRADPISNPDGTYQVRMQAVANDAPLAGKADKSAAGIDAALAAGGADVIEQTWELSVGKTAAPAMPAFQALNTSKPARTAAKTQDQLSVQTMAPATGSLPYTVYLANLHSQTNHSDGGGPVGSCSGSQAPLSAPFGPSDAFAYAKGRGLDMLMTSEHNHMFDGSSGTNTSANPATAKALYQSGLTAAADFNAANPNFLAVYGMEWGVINNGGHLNIFNSSDLLGWEYNSSGQLIADILTEKTDYAGLYTMMRQRGYVGQFNHPSTSGQFLVGGVPLGYSADGDQAMALCEVLNTSAFSVNTTETETGRSNFEAACQKALESGFHVAFSTNQDNHCANWGASYTNRTGILIPTGTPLTQDSFVAAVKARRVFASMDKNSQLVLTANGHVMGERFANSGALNLVANYANTAGQTVSTVSIIEGVPGRNGTPTEVSSTASTTITPANGEHYYYAKVTQSDGKILWSAPVWVTQGGAGDSVQPTVSAAESGTSGTIVVSANASDNVGVTMVEFYVDNVLKASSNVAPYSASINSTTLANGSHSLVARAYDAAGNVGVSTAVAFSVNNSTVDSTPPAVTAAESGSSGAITLSASASDNVGVSTVEFYVDNVLKGTDSTAPYALTLDSLTLSNASHALTARAYDAANNSTLSAPVNFTVSNVAAVQRIVNPGFESGAASWTASTGVITTDAGQAAHGGSWKAWLNGYGAAHTDSVYQQVAIPAAATSATLKFWLKVVSAETTTTGAFDTLKVQVRSSSGAVLATLATYSNLNKGATFVEKSFDLSAYKGQTVRVYFEGVEGSTVATSFVLDDVTLSTQ
ncbi:CehA/McbA family metallohydrolase [Massilia sp. TSP1-1-2]|uniref:CehA/McbA family metallohydrolase n=1 Tax=Massilia sp. TSP1-1-2 TaxID=2804649 RepID=UPI003CED9ADC